MVSKFQQLYTPEKECSVDESIIKVVSIYTVPAQKA